MTSLFLPAPIRNKQQNVATTKNKNKNKSSSQLAIINNKAKTNLPTTNNHNRKARPRAPSYGERCRSAAAFSRLTPAERSKSATKKLFVPRSTHDFDDGGAFPEIHVAQYPKNMGNPHLNRDRQSGSGTDDGKKGKGSKPNSDIGSSSSTTRAIVNVQIDAAGNKDYTSLIKSGTNKHQTLYARHSDLRGYNPTPSDLALPTQDQEQQSQAKTQAAIDALLSNKIALSKPSGTALQNAATSMNQEDKTQFIEYKADPTAPGYNPSAAKRVIQMVPAQIDPMMPPKHKHLKAPAGPADDFVPVLHAPPEKLTKEERDAWNIPACISNWKNTRGYTIPLDKRLAADGRGLRDDTTINSNFATLAESLYLAERQAREEVRLRGLVQKRQMEGDREKRERELRDLAMKARMERSGVMTMTGSGNNGNGGSGSNGPESGDNDEESVIPSQGQAANPHPDSTTANLVPVSAEDEESRMEAEKRDRIRHARRKERERELRMEKHRPKNNQDAEEEDVELKKARLGDRDISEKIALGVHTGTGSLAGGVDGRLYNQNAGMDSGFGADDEYNTYSKPMFDREGVTSSSIYRPTRGEGAMDADEQYAELKAGATSRFQPDKGFSGAEGGRSVSAGPRNAPVQFERGGQK